MLKQIKDLKTRISENPELKPIYIGMLNYFSDNKKAKDLAEKRYLESCKKCDYFVDEENELLKINDKSIPELSNKKCGLCGCVNSFKLRQSINKCDKWEL